MLLNRERALAVMERYGLDALVAATPENVYYLSDYGASHSFLFRNYGVSAAVLPRDESIPPTLLVGEVDVPYLAAKPTWMPELRMIGSFGSHISPHLELTERESAVRDLWAGLRTKGLRSPNRQEVLAGVLRELGLAGKRLGIDDLRVTAELREAGVATEDAVDAMNVFREIRLVKTPDEIALMRRAAQINDSCLLAASNLLVEGTTAREISRFWKSQMALQGAIGEEFYAGGFDRPWFIGPDDYRLRDGDHMLFDCGGTYRYYWADVGRTGCVGTPSQRVREAHAAAVDVYGRCLPLLRPGNSTAEIKQAALEAAREHGLADGWVPLMHPMGIEVYDMPQPLGEVEREDFTIEIDMVVSYECCLYVEFPWGVVQLEDTFVVREDGLERLGALPHDLLGPDA